MMTRCNVGIHSLAAGAVPVGRIPNFAWASFAMVDQKSMVNLLRGGNNDLACLIIFGGVNDWLYQGNDSVLSYQNAIMEMGYYAKQIGIPKVVVVSPLRVITKDANLPDPENDPNRQYQLSEFRAGASWAVSCLDGFNVDATYIDGLSLMPDNPACYEQEGIHPSNYGREIWVNNLVTQLQGLGIFPQDYA
jgi:hypothetical protein